MSAWGPSADHLPPKEGRPPAPRKADIARFANFAATNVGAPPRSWNHGLRISRPPSRPEGDPSARVILTLALSQAGRFARTRAFVSLTPAELTGLARAYRNITVPDTAIAASNIAATRGAPQAGILPSR
jgi:hypothetical protein